MIALNEISYQHWTIGIVENDTLIKMFGPNRSAQAQGSLGTWFKEEGVLASTLENMDSLDMDYSSSAGSPYVQKTVKTRAGFLDHAGSIGEAISTALASSRRQPQRHPHSSIEDGSKEANIADYDSLLAGLRSHTVRNILSEKAITHWYKTVNQFNEAGKTMGDYRYWKEQMGKLFTQSVNFKISENWEGSLKSFDLSFPMMCTVWEAFSRCGQTCLEMRPSRVRAQVLNNGSIIIEDAECGYVGRWRDGSSLDRKVCVKSSLDLSLTVQCVELRFLGTMPTPNWFELEKLLDASISNSQRLEKLERLIKLAQVIDRTPKSMDESFSPHNVAMNNELQSNVKAFATFSDAGKHQRAQTALQVADSMCSLTELLIYQKEKRIASPLRALDQYVRDYSGFHSPDLPMGKIPTTNTQSTLSIYGQPFTMPIKKDKKTTTKKRRVTKKPTSSFRNKDEGRGNNTIPGTNKIRF